MKRTDIFIISLVLSFVTTSCSEDEPLLPDGGAQPVSLRVVAADFSSTDNTTRATEEGYVTKFAAEDKIGIFAVTADGKIWDKNVPYKYNGTTWVPVNAANTVHHYNYLDGVSYFAYYPYSATMDNATSENDIIAAFSPQADQKTYAGYTASDLMTGAGTLSDTGEPRTLTLQLKHRMTLLVLCPDLYANCVAPAGAGYEYYPEARVKGVATNVKINNTTAYAVGDDTYRLIVKPETMDVPLEYTLGTTVTSHTFTAQALTSGTYRQFKLGHQPLTITRAMQIGDYYYNDGKLAPGADGEEPLYKEKCIGVVFHVGPGTGDNLSDYSGTGLASRDRIRGYVVALTEQEAGYNEYYKWADNGSLLIGTSTNIADFKGYFNTSLIVQKTTGSLVAARAAKNYSCPHGTPPANSSGWYLGSAGQMGRIEENSASKIVPSLSKAGGNNLSGLYYTSTESDAENCYMYVPGSAPLSIPKLMTTSNNRAVLTF